MKFCEFRLTTWCLLTVAFLLASNAEHYRPIVMWHGMGDTSKGSVVHLEKLIQHQLNNSVYIHSIQIGSNQEEDFFDTYFKDCNEQIDIACAQLLNDAQLSTDGLTILGFSQGGQFARALIQRCPLQGPILLITFGGQHQGKRVIQKNFLIFLMRFLCFLMFLGIYGLPRCPGTSVSLCNYIRKMINLGAYLDMVQKHLVQAQYWHDPLNKEYRAKSRFLADINNERQPRNQTYKKRLSSVEKFVMVQFDDDTIVSPKESSLFSFYKDGQAKQVLPLEQSALYKEDWLGLKKLDTNGQLIRLHTPGDHLDFTDEWFIENILDPYLRVEVV